MGGVDRDSRHGLDGAVAWLEEGNDTVEGKGLRVGERAREVGLELLPFYA